MSAARAVGKEVRALLPAFAATLVTIGLATGANVHFRVRILLLAACLGPIALGALAIGHEYSYRTLTLMLAQPRRRLDIFLIKAGVLVTMIAATGAAIVFALPQPVRDRFASAPSDVRVLLILGPLCGLCLAPALSMICRGTLAAIVFSIAIPGTLVTAAEVAASTAIYGFTNPGAVRAFTLAFIWQAIPLLCAGGALTSWFLFNRLQAIEGEREFQLPAWVSRAGTGARPARRVQSPWTALLWKELRLQELAYVVALLYVLVATAVWALRVARPDYPPIPFEGLSVLYSGLLGVLIGAIASAEERQLGTLESQLLQPLAALKQWALKAGTVTALALALGVALPLVVTPLVGSPDGPVIQHSRFVQRTLVPLLVLPSLSLYVSSLSSSGIRAMITSLPAIFGGGLFGMMVSDVLVRALRKSYVLAPQGTPTAERIATYQTMQSVTDAAVLIGFAVLALTALWLGFLNHRHVDRTRTSLLVQTVILLAVFAGIVAVPTLVWVIFRPEA